MREHSEKCQRCGTCCRKGPPGLHREDAVLYEQGLLRKEHCLTLRAGEWVYDNVLGQRIVLKEDMLRLRSKRLDAACLFFDAEDNSCQIYADRPFECRILQCWDSRETISSYARDRLSRFDLVPGNSALYAIMSHHGTVCGYDRIRPLTAAVRNQATKRSSAVEALWDIIQQDRSIRDSLQQSTGVDDPVLEFLFGRPLEKTLPGFGLEVRDSGQNVRFVPSRF